MIAAKCFESLLLSIKRWGSRQFFIVDVPLRFVNFSFPKKTKYRSWELLKHKGVYNQSFLSQFEKIIFTAWGKLSSLSLGVSVFILHSSGQTWSEFSCCDLNTILRDLNYSYTRQNTGPTFLCCLAVTEYLNNVHNLHVILTVLYMYTPHRNIISLALGWDLWCT